MSKIYAKYLELKEKDKEKLYLFKSGKFYIFIADDCDAINDYVVLKKVKFTNEVYKCGFPENVLEDYLRVFKNHNLNIELVDNTNLNNNSIYDKKLKMLFFPYFMGYSKILGTILGTNIL